MYAVYIDVFVAINVFEFGFWILNIHIYIYSATYNVQLPSWVKHGIRIERHVSVLMMALTDLNIMIRAVCQVTYIAIIQNMGILTPVRTDFVLKQPPVSLQPRQVLYFSQPLCYLPWKCFASYRACERYPNSLANSTLHCKRTPVGQIKVRLIYSWLPFLYPLCSFLGTHSGRE